MNHENFSTLDQQTCDTLHPYPETDQQPTDEQTTTTTTSSTSTSTSRARARACAREAAAELPPIERLHQTRDLYESSVGRMTPVVGQQIERYLRSGMEIDVIEHAISETGWARRPSANYLFAILRRYFDSEIFTYNALMDDLARHEADKQARQARRAARWYDEDDPNPIWF